MANTVYANFVLENKMRDLLNTKLDTRNLMTIDYSLTESAGMLKKVNTYNYTGAVEAVAKGLGNTTKGAVSFTPSTYEVKVAQQTFVYYDEEFMADPYVVDAGLNGMSSLMVNDMNSKYFAELAKTTNTSDYSGTLSYDAVVDAIQVMNIEDENGLFLIITPALKAEVRKDPDFKSAQQGQIIYSGQIGTISGVPVVVSKATDAAYLATKEAVTLFTKKETSIEQDRNIEKRENTIVAGKVNLVALTDASKAVKLVKTGA